MSEDRMSVIKAELSELETELEKLDKASDAIRNEIKKLNDEHEQLELSKMVPFDIGQTVRFGLMGRYAVEPERWSRGKIIKFKGPYYKFEGTIVTLVVDATSASGAVTCRKEIEYPNHNVAVVSESDFPGLIENMKEHIKASAKLDEELSEAAKKRIDRLKLEHQAVNLQEKIRVQKTVQGSGGVVSKPVRGEKNKQGDKPGNGKSARVHRTGKRSR